MCWDASNSTWVIKMTSAASTMYPFIETSFKMDPAVPTSSSTYSGYTSSSQTAGTSLLSHGQPQVSAQPGAASNAHAYHAASMAASGLYDPQRMFNGFNGFHSNAESFPGLNDPMQSWAAQHHMVQHSNQMYPTHMNGMSAHQAVVASAAAASASPAGAFFRYMRTAPGTTIHGGFSPGGK
jgi:hypothetical protein